MMSVTKMEFEDPDSVDGQIDAGIDIIDDKGNIVPESPNAEEYVLSGTEDNIFAYRIVHVSDDSTKINQNVHTTSVAMNNSVTTSVPQQLQYIVIDSSNGFLQAVPTTQIATAIPSTTPSSIKVETPSNTNNINSSNPLKMRTSVAIAPKTDSVHTTPYNSISSNNKSNSSTIDSLSSFKKRDDRRRATHNEVERRRRDKINHWIMKLGNIIPADGSAVEIGDSNRLSIAAIEGQSKGGILSKACEYVQFLQQKQTTRNENASKSVDNQTMLEKKKYEDEIARLRGENELLKAILIKNGINYVKERTSFKANEYS